jgi:hypothetical protein
MKIEMKFSFKAIKELLEVTGVSLENVGELAKDIKNIAIIGHIGNKHAGGNLTIEEIEEQLDKGDFKDVLAIANQFGEQVTAYFTPNENSQAQ